MRTNAITAALAGAALLSTVAVAKADVVFCNEFAETIYVAIAYPQGDNSWLSRGWLELANGECRPFDTALALKSFSYRAESDPFRSGGRRVKNVWGSGQSFAIWEDDNFEYWGAEERVLKSTLAPFSQGPEATGGGVLAVTVTFLADGKTTSVVLH